MQAQVSEFRAQGLPGNPQQEGGPLLVEAGVLQDAGEQEAQRFTKEWARRRNGPVIQQLTRWCETRRQDAVNSVLSRLKGKLSDAACAAIEKAFSRFQNRLLHGPISVLTEETHAGAASGYTLAEALLKLFRLPD